MELKNVSRYTPKKMKFGSGVQYFRSEDGQDFYDAFDKFTKKHKLCIEPDTGIIRSVAEDVSRLYPAGFTVVDVDALPAGIDIVGNWQYLDGKISPVPVDYAALAEAEREKRLVEAGVLTKDWQTDLLLGIITDEDKALLTAWRDYIKKLKALDFSGVKDGVSYNAIEWPEAKPD
ncbi:phage tail protein [Salmonella enterica subsp. enterica]|nr:phage tail protein [Salmonella enterica]ECC3814931.1 phage tail protein [Salmonella enterica subsp. enterica]ECN6005578.1 tail fiber assembly protein [Salmonella enterica subsp. enterica serovar Brandenburg]EDU6784085.1 tail fiber assembly protein [Salmonella enterica subsp. enterica serovar Gaminara]EHB3478038.1 tail fiber assembly protein [Salmonella enterica subsp. enterica serovar Newport]